MDDAEWVGPGRDLHLAAVDAGLLVSRHEEVDPQRLVARQAARTGSAYGERTRQRHERIRPVASTAVLAGGCVDLDEVLVEERRVRRSEQMLAAGERRDPDAYILERLTVRRDDEVKRRVLASHGRQPHRARRLVVDAVVRHLRAVAMLDLLGAAGGPDDRGRRGHAGTGDIGRTGRVGSTIGRRSSHDAADESGESGCRGHRDVSPHESS